MSGERSNSRAVVRNRDESPPVQLGTGPLRSLGTLVFSIALTIFCAEVFVMLLLQFFPELSPHVEALVDSVLLIVLLIPAFLYLIYKPLRGQVQEIEAAQLAYTVSEQRFSDVAAHVGEWIWEVDAEGRYTYSNPIVEEILGYRPDEMLGKHFYDFFIPEEREELKLAAFRVFEAKQSFNAFINRNLHRDGRVVTLETSGLPLLDEQGRLVGYRGADRDISEQIAARQRLLAAKTEAEAANKAKSTFLANMSHELRTPLNGTLGMLDLLVDSRLDATQREQVEMARDSAQRLLRLIDQLLEFSRLETSQLPIRTQSFDPHEMVETVGASMRPAAENKGLRLEIVCHPMMPHRLIGDPGHIGAVLEHLVNNAIKFTHEGHVRIEADYQAGKDHEGTLHLNVLDSGIGLPQGSHEALFEEFTQGEDHSARRFGGTGLGLALCRRLVEAMQGRIGADQRASGGALFWVALPLPHSGLPGD
ncbi:MAG: ATP-binding protein [Gammaproteobacteria bacterium]|nr:ATP-binding protein [Gammaproteobacteria bacterium]